MLNDSRVLSREERDFLVGIDVSIDIVGDTNPDLACRVMGEVIGVQDPAGYKGGIILLCEGEFNRTSPFDGEKEARADALRMAQLLSKITFFEKRITWDEAEIINKEANEIIAKYEE